MELPFSTPVVIDAKLDVAECLHRLDEAVIYESIISPWAIFTSRSAHPVAGTVRGDKVILRWRTFYSNSFQRLLRLSAKPGPMGCRLSGEFSMLRFAYVFSAVWFGFLSIFAIVWTVDLIRGQVKPVGDATYWLNFVPYLMLIFGYALLRFGLWLSSRTESKLLQFVMKTVDGRAADAS
jgi:hypothetical protein